MSRSRPPSVPPDIPGFGPVSLLGAGGFADVFLYSQERPARRVAIKVMHSAGDRPGGDHFPYGGFDDEADLMARVSTHPSIATIYQTGVTTDGRQFIVMEYCPNGSLDARYRRERMRVSEVLRIGVELAGAVESAHRAGITHRDIKPANVLVTEYDRAALTDFGISVGDASAGESGSLGLSVPWSPPEVLAGEVTDGRAADVYSLAATVYSLLAGRSPFELPGGPNDAAAVSRRIAEAPLSPTGRADVPPALERVLAVGMARDPAQRFPTALEFGRALQTVQAQMHERLTPLDVAKDLGSLALLPRTDVRADPNTVLRPAKGAPPPSPRWPSLTGSPPSQHGTVTGGGAAMEAGEAQAADGADATVLRSTRPASEGGPAPVSVPPRRRRRRGVILAMASVALAAAAVASLVVVQGGWRLPGSLGVVAQAAPAVPTRESPTPTIEPSPAPTPTVTVTVTPPAPRGDGDLSLSVPIANLPCTGEYIVLMASTDDPNQYDSLVTANLAADPDARYLRTDASCRGFHQSINGNAIYAVYEGPFATKDAACAALNASTAPVDAAVRALVADPERKREYCTCLLSPEELPQLSVQTAADPVTGLGRFVAEVQWMLTMAGFSPAIDGSYGTETEEQVRAFQEARQLEPIGEVGPLTWGALRSQFCP